MGIGFEVTGSKLWLINFYQEQLDKFVKLGIGNQTENGIRVTERLIKVTQQRLAKISVVYDARLTKTAHNVRSMKLKQAMKRRQLGANNNGTTTASRVQDNGNTGHEGGE